MFSAAILLAVTSCALILGPFGPTGFPDPTIIQTVPKPDFFFWWIYTILSFLPENLETPFILIAPVVGIAFLLALPFFALLQSCSNGFELVCKLINLSVLAPVEGAAALALRTFVLQRLGALKSDVLPAIIAGHGEEFALARGGKHALTQCFRDVDGLVLNLRTALGAIVAATILPHRQHILGRL